MDPVFPDFDFVMGYTTSQRILREQVRAAAGGTDGSVSVADSFGVPL
jgi:hypothetical protein